MSGRSGNHCLAHVIRAASSRMSRQTALRTAKQSERQLCHAVSGGWDMVRVVIPSYSQSKSKTGQPFTVYNVDVYWNGRSHSLERRYRDFHELHCDLRKSRRCLPDFPPKKLRNLSSKVVEERRHLLEVYLQAVASLPLLPRQLVQFLELPRQPGDAIAVDDSCLVDSDADEELTHRPAIGFTAAEEWEQWGRWEKTGATGSGECGALPDVVVKSSVAAFYSDRQEDWYKM